MRLPTTEQGLINLIEQAEKNLHSLRLEKARKG